MGLFGWVTSIFDPEPEDMSFFTTTSIGPVNWTITTTTTAKKKKHRKSVAVGYGMRRY